MDTDGFILYILASLVLIGLSYSQAIDLQEKVARQERRIAQLKKVEEAKRRWRISQPAKLGNIADCGGLVLKW